MTDERDTLHAKAAALQNEYNQVRSHVQLLDRQCIILGVGFAPLVAVLSEKLLVPRAGFLLMVVPILLGSVISLILYLRSAVQFYNYSCREIENKINSLFGDPGLLQFENKHREKMDRKYFRKWGPATVMYTLSGAGGGLLYVYTSVQACRALYELCQNRVASVLLVIVGCVLYLGIFAVLVLAGRQSIKAWQDLFPHVKVESITQ